MLRTISFYLLFSVLLLITSYPCWGQQQPDVSDLPEIEDPAYSAGDGPILCIDGAHNNLHRLDTGFAPFAEYLKQDGYRMVANEKQFEEGVPDTCSVLVIVNALHESNLGNWVLPTPSAFTEKEIEMLESWVSGGGRLFLIADHMPYPGAAEELAAAFGFTFNNGFALNPERLGSPSIFTKSDGTLKDLSLIDGIDSVASYTGQAFHIPKSAISVLTFGDDHYTLMPDTAWQFSADTPQESVEGWSQGAILEYGKGKVAVFGEAAMFTSQRVGEAERTVGITDPGAPQNARFLLSIIHWLDPAFTFSD